MVGGPGDNSSLGAAWIWTRTGDVWSQQTGKLVGSGAVGAAAQGASLSLSADGNTAIVGGPGDNNSLGAAWIWTRAGDVWTQQTGKLVGSGAVGAAAQGASVSLSADGNTAIVGAPQDAVPGDFPFFPVGAVWVWTRSAGVWRQQGPKLVGAGAVAGRAAQGSSVSVSADGTIALVGGPRDGRRSGGAWVLIRSDGRWMPQGPE